MLEKDEMEEVKGQRVILLLPPISLRTWLNELVDRSTWRGFVAASGRRSLLFLSFFIFLWEVRWIDNQIWSRPCSEQTTENTQNPVTSHRYLG